MHYQQPKGQKMNDMKLTRRGKAVVAVIAILAGYLLVSAVFNSVTPTECKVPTKELSQGCITLLYG